MDDLDLDPEMTEGEADRLVRLSIGFAASTVVTCAFGAVSAVVIALLARDHCSPRLKPLVDLTLVGAPLLAVLQVGLVAVWAMSEPSAEVAATTPPGTVLTPAPPPGPSPTQAEADQAAADCTAGKAAYIAGDRTQIAAHTGQLASNTDRWNQEHTAAVVGGAEALLCRDLLKDLLRGEEALQSGEQYMAGERYYEASMSWADGERFIKAHSGHPEVGGAVSKRLSEFRQLRKQHAARIRRDKPVYEAHLKRDSERIALEILCGAAPMPNWSRETYPVVKDYLKKVSHDPKSVDLVACTPAVYTKSCWETTCEWRGKNGFGALRLFSNTFYIGVAGVIDVK